MTTINKLLITSIQCALLFSILANVSVARELDNALSKGEEEYQRSCSLCHGEDAKGDGPYSIALVFKPSDLTQILRENDGEFPFLEIYFVIDGRDMTKVHGTRLMPIWGDRYNDESWSHASPEYSDTLVRGRIFELLLYLYSIQEPVK